MGLSQADAQIAYDAAFAAWQAAVSNKSYAINGRSVTRHDIDKLWQQVIACKQTLERASGSSPMFARTHITGLG